MCKVVRRYKELFTLKVDFRDHGNYVVSSLLSFIYYGIRLGDKTLLDIVPATRKRETLMLWVHALLNLHTYKVRGTTQSKIVDYIKEISYHVDGKGRIAYISVPTNWLEKVGEVEV